MKFYLTTAIDYPNSLPHVGTAFEKVGADIQARYQRMIGNEVFFLMGNDENTWKVASRAKELGLEPKKYVDDMATKFKDIWRSLNISFDDFIQTTEERHRIGVEIFLNAVNNAGYIDKRKYRGETLDRHRISPAQLRDSQSRWWGISRGQDHRDIRSAIVRKVPPRVRRCLHSPVDGRASRVHRH
jgi:hypothetical protein